MKEKIRHGKKSMYSANNSKYNAVSTHSTKSEEEYNYGACTKTRQVFFVLSSSLPLEELSYLITTRNLSVQYEVWNLFSNKKQF